MKPLKNQLEALTQSLVLAVTASNEKRSQEALKLVEGFTIGLTKTDIESCKLRAETILDGMKNHAQIH